MYEIHEIAQWPSAASTVNRDGFHCQSFVCKLKPDICKYNQIKMINVKR